ncbi:MAG TPA: VWA domain-containing protein [Terracidiphilus sp.]|nr:VWA domain-containing protein [Terracidiphilus sp.]
MQASALLPAILSLCALSLPAGALAQSAALTSTTLTLNIAVADKSGQPVRGLTQAQFTLLDNKKPLNILNFHEVTAVTPQDPAQAVILIDGIDSPLSRIADVRRRIADYLRAAGPQLPMPMSLAFLTDQGLKTQEEPTRDPKVLLANLENNPLPQQVHAITTDYNFEADFRQKSLGAVDLLTQHLSNRPGRKLIIWVTPGWLSFESQTVQKSRDQLNQLFTYITNLNTVLRRADIALYQVDPGSATGHFRAGESQYGSFLHGASSADDADNADIMLSVLAIQSGGLVLYGSNDIMGLISQCLADASAYYEVTVQTPIPGHADGAHRITVKMPDKHMKARTRTLYYAIP